MGCNSSSEPKQEVDKTIPGQDLLGLCWRLDASDNEFVWSPVEAGRLPNYAFTLLKSSKRAAKHFLSATCDRNVGITKEGTVTTVRVFSDDDILRDKELRFAVGAHVGLTGSVGVGGEAKVREKQNKGARDVYMVATKEVYRLKLNIAAGVKYDANGGIVDPDPAGDDGYDMCSSSSSSEDDEANSPSKKKGETNNKNEPTTATGGQGDSASPKKRKKVRKNRTYIRRQPVDVENISGCGTGAVTDAICGGRMIVKIHQMNYSDLVKEFGGHASFEIGPGQVGAKAGGSHRNQKGAKKINFTIIERGGRTSNKKSFTDCTVDDVEELVAKWSDSLDEDATLCVPLRVGVYFYHALDRLVRCVGGGARGGGVACGDSSAEQQREQQQEYQRQQFLILRKQYEELCDSYRSLESEKEILAEKVVTMEKEEEERKQKEAEAAQVADEVSVSSSSPKPSSASFEAVGADAEKTDFAELLMHRYIATRRKAALPPFRIAQYLRRLAIPQSVQDANASGDPTQLDLTSMKDAGDEAALWAAITLYRSDSVTKILLGATGMTDCGAAVLAPFLDGSARVNVCNHLEDEEGEHHRHHDVASLEVINVSSNDLTAAGINTILRAVLTAESSSTGSPSGSAASPLVPLGTEGSGEKKKRDRNLLIDVQNNRKAKAKGGGATGGGDSDPMDLMEMDRLAEQLRQLGAEVVLPAVK